MAKGKKTGGKDFQLGHEPTPGGGRPRLSVHDKAFRAMNGSRLAEILNTLINCSKEEIMEKAKDPSLSIFELAIASILSKAVQQGDHKRIDAILDRLVGKPKQSIEVTNPYAGKSLQELEELVKTHIVGK